ncbi:MAG: hypothetical protein QOG42_350 [Solirubrobacteraceae bacterium]|nr:hypothetical protein [Solirubrobacteraceae bacterium]
MSLMKQLSQLAKSKQGKELLDKAKTIANDPKTREKLEDARGKFNEHVETAKHKIAEKKAKDAEAPGAGSPTYGEADKPATPTYGETDTPTNGAAGSTATPPGSGSADTPTYGEDGPADAPTYGEDGPKAA